MFSHLVGAYKFVKLAIKYIRKVNFTPVNIKQTASDLPSVFQYICKLEKVLIAKRLLRKNVTVLPRQQMEKITGTICNVPIDTVDYTNLLPSSSDRNGLVIYEFVERKPHLTGGNLNQGFWS